MQKDALPMKESMKVSSQSVFFRSATSVPSETLLKMQIPGPHLLNQKLWGDAPEICFQVIAKHVNV